MKMDFKEYQDMQIKAKKFYEINLKNVAFEHSDIVRDAIQWFISHDYQKLKAIANKNEAFENSLNVFVYLLKCILRLNCPIFTVKLPQYNGKTATLKTVLPR